MNQPLSKPPFPLIDVHVHLGPSDTGEVYYPHLSGDEYLGLMDAARVEQACAFAPLRTDGYQAANVSLKTWSASINGRVRAFARLGGRAVPMTEPELWLLRRKASSLLRRRPPDFDYLEDLGSFAGVKLAPHLDGLPSDAVFAYIAELALPVLVHAGRYSPPRWIERVILPKVRGPVILAHLGAFPCVEPMLREAVDMAQHHPNVYLDTSGAWISSFIRYAAERVPEKLLFGSDAPLAHPLVAWHHVASVVRDEHLLERIGRGTARELFGWEPDVQAQTSKPETTD